LQRRHFFSVIALVPETLVDSRTERLDLGLLFGRTAPLQVDLGCGDGSFLCELAQGNPDTNFLGIERLSGRVAKVCRKAAPLKNVRVIHCDSSYAVSTLLPEKSVKIFYLLFPDPWPKRRHHRRRIMTTEFLESIHRVLELNGILRIATDHREYFQQIERVVSNASETTRLKLDGLKPSSFEIIRLRDDDLPRTKFERRFQEQGIPIYRLKFRKISPVI
jgi:tRNA (guanine-N7-)-methyltransferase